MPTKLHRITINLTDRLHELLTAAGRPQNRKVAAEAVYRLMRSFEMEGEMVVEATEVEPVRERIKRKSAG